MRAGLLALALTLAAGCATGSAGPADAGADGAPEVSFPCGDMRCAPSQMCAISVAAADDDAGAPPPPACAELPEVCGGAPTCVCLQTACRLITGAVCRSGLAVGLIYCLR